MGLWVSGSREGVEYRPTAIDNRVEGPPLAHRIHLRVRFIRHDILRYWAMACIFCHGTGYLATFAHAVMSEVPLYICLARLIICLSFETLFGLFIGIL